MIKKIMALAFLALLLTVSPVGAQDAETGQTEKSGDFTAAELASLAKEPSLTQADIDAFIKLANVPENDTKAAEKAVEESGLSETRLTLVLTKISLGMMIAAGAPKDMILTKDVPKVLQPSDTELELIRTNLENLTAE